MKILIWLLSICFFSVIISCSGTEEIDFKFGKGTYKFTMSDSVGKKIAVGNIIIAEYNINKIAGTYYFTKVYQEDFDGLSVMNGNFEGNVIPQEKTVFINTNPRIADANVFWNMKIYKNSVSGEWNHSVFRGSMSKGKVKITQ